MFQACRGFTNRVNAVRVQREDGSKFVFGTFVCNAQMCLAGRPQAVFDVIVSLAMLIIRTNRE